jgi:hypothetical protein
VKSRFQTLLSNGWVNSYCYTEDDEEAKLAAAVRALEGRIAMLTFQWPAED